MRTNKSLLAVAVGVLCTGMSFAQDISGVFVPAIFWAANTDKGVLLTAPAEMEIVDANGSRHGKIRASGQVFGAYMSPDGKKLVYTTSSGLWFYNMETRETSLLAPGTCDYLRWKSDSMSFMFAIFEKAGSGDNTFKPKLFWADGDGKNVKQVYP